MSALGLLQVLIFLAVTLATAVPLGRAIAPVFAGKRTALDPVVARLEALVYRSAGVSKDHEQTWQQYAASMLTFNGLGVLAVYALERLQSVLPLNPEGLPAPSPDLSWNTAMSFATNTDWQSYAGESTMSYFTQMVGLTVQNFVCAASGMAVLAALLRGFTRKTSSTIGSFWVDLVRSTLYVLLPIALVLAVVLASQGVVQTLAAHQTVPLLQATHDDSGQPVTEQTLALGPAASQIAIKMLGTNGGGFFNANSAHPFESPNGFTNFLEMWALLVLPVALCFTFGELVRDRRQGWTVFAAMALVLVPLIFLCILAEQSGNPALRDLGVDQAASPLSPGGNMEGKEARFGIAASGLFATITTAVSCGAVNAMHDSFTPLGGLVPLWLIQLGEVIFGGVGSGLYGMLVFAVIAVFVAGLMVGRTPEYLGKKIEAFEMKMASLVVLVPPATILILTAVAVAVDAGKKGVANPGPHGFSEILYAFSSAANNNGSAFGGLSANTPFYNTTLGIAMFFGRFFLKVPVLALAGHLAQKKIVPITAGTLPTHTPLFVGLLTGVVLLVGALTFIPALALGPIVEHLLAHT